jgi:hypothetical protein
MGYGLWRDFFSSYSVTDEVGKEHLRHVTVEMSIFRPNNDNDAS